MLWQENGNGTATQNAPSQSAVRGVEADEAVLTVLYGSETGNAQEVAENAAKRACEKGLKARGLDMRDYKFRELKHERLLLIVTATHGEGDPPEPAQDFYELLHSRKAPRLTGARFAVLGLGDSSYEHFCQTGKDFDTRLEALDAHRLQARTDCDVDYEDVAYPWIEETLDRFVQDAGTHGEAAIGQKVFQDYAVSRPEVKSAPDYGKKKPFPAEILDRVLLTGRGSRKETYHIELSLAGFGLMFEPATFNALELARQRQFWTCAHFESGLA